MEILFADGLDAADPLLVDRVARSLGSGGVAVLPHGLRLRHLLRRDSEQPGARANLRGQEARQGADASVVRGGCVRPGPLRKGCPRMGAPAGRALLARRAHAGGAGVRSRARGVRAASSGRGHHRAARTRVRARPRHRARPWVPRRPDERQRPRRPLRHLRGEPRACRRGGGRPCGGRGPCHGGRRLDHRGRHGALPRVLREGAISEAEVLLAAGA